MAARRATVEDILTSGETDLVIPDLLDETGQPMTIRVRKIHAGEQQALMPPLAPDLYAGLPEDPDTRQQEFEARRRKWAASLTPAQLEERTHQAARFCARVVALASVDPVLTEEQAMRLGYAVDGLAAQILAFSQGAPHPAARAVEPTEPALAGQPA